MAKAWETDPEAAFAEAKRRIAAWEEGESLDLSIPALQTLPKSLSNLTTLQEFYVNNTLIQDANLSVISNLASLRKLSLNQTQISDAGLPALSNLPALQTLYLNNTQISDVGLATLSDLPELQILDIGNTHISDAGFPFPFDLTAFKVLYLSNTHISDAGLRALSGLPALQELYLSHTQISAAGLTDLTDLPSLLLLDLSNTHISDAGLPALSDLPGLQRLDLGNTRISDLRTTLNIQPLFSPERSYHGLHFENPPDTMAAELQEILKISDGTERMPALKTYLESLPPWPQPLDGSAVDTTQDRFQQKTSLTIGVVADRVDVKAAIPDHHTPATPAQKVAYDKVKSALPELLSASNMQPDLSDPTQNLRVFLGESVTEVQKLQLHMELETIRGIYDRRAERTAADKLEEKTVIALHAVKTFGALLTNDDPDVQAIETALRDYADPTQEMLVSLDNVAKAIREHDELFGQILQLISEKVPDHADPRIKTAGETSYRNTLTYVAELMLVAGTAPALGTIGTEIAQQAAVWLITYPADITALAGNYGASFRATVEEAIEAAKEIVRKKGTDQ